MNASAPTFQIASIELFEREVHLRLPFRFGVVTLTQCPQAFVRVQITLPDGRVATGGAAELMAPKWFDKNLALSNEDNFNQLRESSIAAREAYLAHRGPDTAFGHFALHYAELIAAGKSRGLNSLIACYGPALIDRALLDALCRAMNVSFYEAIQKNLPGIDARLTPDLAAFDIDRFLSQLRPNQHMEVRHTVGLLDPITSADVQHRVDDGLPETLQEVVDATGCRYYKLKVSGNPEADIDRLSRIAAVLKDVQDCKITLDGNEQFHDEESALAFWHRVEETPALRQLTAQTLYIEQPCPRATALSADFRRLAAMRPLLIDESDESLDAFTQALELGYTGISSKQCKGIYRTLLNAARCSFRNEMAGSPVCFMSAEDLTTQAGLSVQQDLALVNLIGLTHVERNGHHYVNGFSGQGANHGEAAAFATAHPGLYELAPDGNARLLIQKGSLDLRSLEAPGFATSAFPEWATLTPMTAGLRP